MLCDTEIVAGYIPVSVAESGEWTKLLQSSHWKPPFSALYGTYKYTFTLIELKHALSENTLAGELGG
jgi:hypothetical protein